MSGLSFLFNFLNDKHNDTMSSDEERLRNFLSFPLVVVRGAGDLATGVIQALKSAGFYVLALETNKPSAIRREVSLSDAVYYGEKRVENLRAKLCDIHNYRNVLENGDVPIVIDPDGELIREIKPYILIDAIIAKKNIGTKKSMADLTIALGPGFVAGQDANADVDIVIETMRGHKLGRVIYEGEALANTGVPGIIAGKGNERVIYSHIVGTFTPIAKIGDLLNEGDLLAEVVAEDGRKDILTAPFKGVLRGILPAGFSVKPGFKSADIDPRESEYENCFTISDKARALGNSVVTAILAELCRRAR